MMIFHSYVDCLPEGSPMAALAQLVIFGKGQKKYIEEAKDNAEAPLGGRHLTQPTPSRC